jgi:hypothetical protein
MFTQQLLVPVEHERQLDKFVYPHELQLGTMLYDTPFTFLMGGWQLGKSSWLPVWLTWMMEQHLGENSILISPTFDQLRDVMVPHLQNTVDGTYYEGVYKRNDHQYITPYGTIFLLSAQDPEHIQGRHVCAVGGDECGQWSYEAWFHTKSRIDRKGGRFLGATTPYFNNWLYHEAFQSWLRRDPNYAFWIGSSLINPAYPREIFERNRATMSPEEFNLFCMGMFAKPPTLVFQEFDRSHCLRNFQKPKMPCVAGMDFGTDPDPTTAVIGHWGKGPLEIYETYYRTNGLAKDHADVVGPMFLRYHIHYVVYDARAKGLQKELAAAIEEKYRLGLDWIPSSGSLLVEDGVWEMKNLIHQNNFLMDAFLCKDMCNEMETWERDKTTGKCKARGPNHTIDPTRYLMWLWKVLARRGEIPEDEERGSQPEPVMLTEGQLSARRTFEDMAAADLRAVDPLDVEDYDGGN